MAGLRALNNRDWVDVPDNDSDWVDVADDSDWVDVAEMPSDDSDRDVIDRIGYDANATNKFLKGLAEAQQQPNYGLRPPARFADLSEGLTPGVTVEKIETRPEFTDLPEGAGRPISTITGEPIPTSEERVAHTNERLKSIGHGLIEGVTTELPGMVGKAMQFAEPDILKGIIGDPGKALADWSERKAKEWYGDPKYEGIEKVLYEGSKMFAPSVIPGGAFNIGVRVILGIDKTIKAAKAAQLAGKMVEAANLFKEANKAAKLAMNVASGTVAGMFGLSQAQQTVDTANQKADEFEQQGRTKEAAAMRQETEGLAPYLTGGIEAAGEFLGTKYLGKLFGLDEAEIVKRGAKQVVTDFLKTLGVEIGTETGQAGLEAQVEKSYGIRPEAKPLQEALEVIGPTAFMTLLTGGAGTVAQGFAGQGVREKASEEKDLFGGKTREQTQRSTYLDKLFTGLENGKITIDHIQGLREKMGDTDPMASVLDDIFFKPSLQTEMEAGISSEEAAEDTTDFKAKLRNQAIINKANLEQKAATEAQQQPVETQPTTTMFGTEAPDATEIRRDEEQLFRPEQRGMEEAQPEQVAVQPGEAEALRPSPGEGSQNLQQQAQAEPGGPERIDEAAHEAATSPLNELPEPTEAQKEAGNYKHGHIRVQGLDISIENPDGSIRSGTAPDGTEWQTKMVGHYGYFKRTKGKDGDQVDVFVNPGERKKKYHAFIVDQVDPETGKFDEHKVMLGYASEEDARKGYLANYEPGWKGLGNIAEVPMGRFRKWLAEGKQAKPYQPVAPPTTEPVPTPVPAEKAPAPTKPAPTEPYLMTRDEFESIYGKPTGKTTVTGGFSAHKEAIRTALNSGKLSPAEAIRLHKDAYPDIEAWPEMKLAEPVTTAIEKEAKSEAAAPAKPEPKPALKEPRDMTRKEYASPEGYENVPVEAFPNTIQSAYLSRSKDHKEIIQKALSEGYYEKAVAEGRMTQGQVDNILKEYPDLVKPGETKLTGKERIQTAFKPKESKARTLRGRIKEEGGINFLNFKGELKNLSTAVKFLSKKTGRPIDTLEQTLKDEGWLYQNESLLDILRDPRVLSRDKVGREISEKKAYELTPEERKLKKEMAYEPEAPPEGEYKTINAEDLPVGKQLTLLDGKSKQGWDVYEVTEKDPFSITLKDGETIELRPLDKVEILESDLVSLPKPFIYAVAIKANDGTIYKGTPGEIHSDVMLRIPFPKKKGIKYDNHGFIDNEGKFYTRAETSIAVGEFEAKAMMAKDLMPKTEPKTKTALPSKPALSRQLAKELLSLPWTDQAYPYGNSNTDLRQRILEKLTGTKPPALKSGVGKVVNALLDAAGITKEGKSIAGYESELREWLKGVAEKEETNLPKKIPTKQEKLFTEKLFDKLEEGGVEYDYEKIQPTKRGVIPAETKVAEGKERGIPARGRGVLSQPEIVSEKAGIYKAAKKKILTSDDLAHLADVNIGRQAQENVLSVVTDINGNILSIYRHSLGTAGQTLATPSTMVGQALNNPKSYKIWTSHNHPSGISELSDADIQMKDALVNLLKGTRLKLGGFIAVGEGEYSEFIGERSKKISTEAALKKIPVSERVFLKRGDRAEGIRDPDDLFKYAEENNIDGLIIFDLQNRPIANIEEGDFSAIRGRIQEDLLKEIEKRNGSAIALIRPNAAISDSEFSNIKKFAKAANLQFLDVIDKEGSFTKRGKNIADALVSDFYTTTEKPALSEKDKGIADFQEANGIRIDMPSLSDEILSKMNKTLRAMGYDVRGTADVKALLESGGIMKDGVLWQPDWISAYQKAVESKGAREAIKAKKAEFKNINWSRLRELGKTTNIKEAGFLSPDGSMIDLSGKKEGGTLGTRAYDYREAGGTIGMQEMMALGHIRFDNNSGMIDMAKEPTSEQYSLLRKIADSHNGYLIVELEDGLGSFNKRDNYYSRSERTFYREYPKGTKPARIINDIKIFYSGQEPRPMRGTVQYSTRIRGNQLSNLTKADIESLPFTKPGTVTQNEDGTFSVSYPNGRGFSIKAVESITPDEIAFKAEYGRGRKPTEKIAGSYSHKERTIRIVKGVGDKWTITKELQHFLEKSGLLKRSEIEAIERQAQAFNKGDFFGANGRARWVEHELKTRSKRRESFMGRIVQKIADILDGFFNLFQQTARGAIRDIESGKVMTREAQPKDVLISRGTGDVAYSTRAAAEGIGAEEARTNIDAAREVLHRHFDDFMYWVVDKNRPINLIQRKLDTVTEKIDLFLKETQRPKITAARVKNFWDESVAPLIKEIARTDKTIPEFEAYAHAKHAHEANKALRLANSWRYLNSLIDLLPKKETLEFRKKIGAEEPKGQTAEPKVYHRLLNEAFNLFGGNEKVEKLKKQWDAFSEKPSGMSDKEATQILDANKSDKDIERLRLTLSTINDEKLDILYNAGLIPEEEYKAIKTKYKNYVPLYREGYEDSVSGSGKGLMQAGRAIKTRGGSTRGVVNILANTISNYENAIDRAEKAESAKVFLSLIKENPHPDIWSIRPEKKAPRHDKQGNLRMYPDIFNVAENEIRIMVNGKQYLVEVNRLNRDAMLMLRTLKTQDKSAGPIVNTLSKINRWLARINTSWSPEFILSNFVRDAQTAGININDTGIESKRIFRGAMDGIKAIYNVEREKESGNEYEELYKRFKASGGKIGWSDVHGSIEKLADKITKELETQKGERPVRKTVGEWLQWTEDANTSVENGIRLHVFKLAVESGKSDLKAAQIASDITIDFTKKGAAGPVINSLYLFANAGIQGSYRLMRAIGTSPKVRKMAAGIIGIGFITGLLNSWAGGGDDDGEDYYNKIEDFVRARNMIIMLPGTKGRYVKIPLPWGYNFVFNIGTELSRVFTKKNYDPINGAARLASVFVDAFNPVASGTLLQTLTPTVIDPFVMVAENKNWFGGPLMPEQNKFEKVPTPDSQRYWKSARMPSVWIASQLNSLTGGNKVRSGAIDISPETLDLIVDTVGGSMLKFWNNLFGIPISLLRKEESQMYEIPFLRRIAGEQSEWADSQIYYDNIRKVLTAGEELKTYRRTDQYKVLREKLSPFIGLIQQAKVAEKKTSRLRKAKKKYQAMGNKERVEKIDKRINQIYKRFNDSYNKALSGEERQ